MNNALKGRIAEGTLPPVFPVLVKGDVQKLKARADALNFQFHYSAGDIASITVDLQSLSALISERIVTRAEFSEGGYTVMNDTMTVRNRIQAVHAGAFPLPSAYDGTNVIIGIIDTGIDWRHADFKDAQGNTRILFIWDQKINGNPPAPFNYGYEWTSAVINASACTHDDVAGNGHGTHVSGVAAGNGLATGKNTGCAPKANIVAVSLNFNLQAPTIADAVQYIFAKATQLGRPCVINASVGNYYGSHDGTDLEAKLIENMVKNVPGRIMVAAGGNGGIAKFHALTQPPLNDTAFTWLKKNTNTINYYCYADTQQIKNVQMSIGANRGTYFNLGAIGFKNYNYALGNVMYDTLKFNGNQIGVIRSSASINAYGVYELHMRIVADTANLFWRVESKGAGLHHSWNFDFVSAGLPTVGQYPRITKYLMPDTMYSLVSSFQCLDDIVTVANYQNLDKYYDYNNTLQSFPGMAGKIMNYSSVGPTRDGRQKPDIAATGEGVFAAAATNMQPNWISNIPNFMAPGGKHVFGTGTSAASPVVAGLGALYLQKNPTATSMQFRLAVTNCAYSDGFTGNLPNYAYGYGKLDGKATLLCTITGENAILHAGTRFNSFPNPFRDQATIQFSASLTGEVFVYSTDGKLIFRERVEGEQHVLDLRSVEHRGLLIVRVVSTAGTVSFKLSRI